MKKPLIPVAITVGPHCYAVVLDEAALIALAANEAELILGNCDTKACVITLDPSAAKSQVRETLIHEVLHAVTALTAIAGDLGEVEESVVTRLAPALLEVLRKNPDLVDYLTAGA